MSDDLAAELRHAASQPSHAVDFRSISERVRSRRRRRRAAGTGSLVALLLVLGGTFAIGRDSGSGTTVETGSGTHENASSMPDEILAVINETGSPDRPQSRLVVLDAATGTEKRTLVPSTPGVGIFSASVSPDGQVVYFELTGAATGPVCERMTLHQVSIHGGSVVPIAAGRYPEVSPDGTKLAYVGGAGAVDCPTRIVVRDLVTGQEASWAPNPAEPSQRASQLSWAPDSRHLAFQPYGPGRHPNIAEVDTADPASTVSTLAARRINWLGYFGTAGDFLYTEYDDDSVDVQVVDPATGEKEAVVITIPNDHTELLAYPDGTTTQISVPIRVVPDRSGQHFLLLDGDTLARISVGDRAESGIGDGYIESAEWVPLVSADDSAPSALTCGTMPPRPLAIPDGFDPAARTAQEQTTSWRHTSLPSILLHNRPPAFRSFPRRESSKRPMGATTSTWSSGYPTKLSGARRCSSPCSGSTAAQSNPRSEHCEINHSYLLRCRSSRAPKRWTRCQQWRRARPRAASHHRIVGASWAHPNAIQPPNERSGHSSRTNRGCCSMATSSSCCLMARLRTAIGPLLTTIGSWSSNSIRHPTAGRSLNGEDPGVDRQGGGCGMSETLSAPPAVVVPLRHMRVPRGDRDGRAGSDSSAPGDLARGDGGQLR
jgi:hypothetical protein